MSRDETLPPRPDKTKAEVEEEGEGGEERRGDVRVGGIGGEVGEERQGGVTVEIGGEGSEEGFEGEGGEERRGGVTGAAEREGSGKEFGEDGGALGERQGGATSSSLSTISITSFAGTFLTARLRLAATSSLFTGTPLLPSPLTLLPLLPSPLPPLPSLLLRSLSRPLPLSLTSPSSASETTAEREEAGVQDMRAGRLRGRDAVFSSASDVVAEEGSDCTPIRARGRRRATPDVTSPSTAFTPCTKGERKMINNEFGSGMEAHLKMRSSVRN